MAVGLSLAEALPFAATSPGAKNPSLLRRVGGRAARDRGRVSSRRRMVVSGVAVAAAFLIAAPVAVVGGFAGSAQAAAGASAVAVSSLPGSYIQGGIQNSGVTTVFGYVKAGESFVTHFADVPGLSNGAVITVKTPTGLVLQNATLAAGAAAPVDFSGTSGADGVWSVSVRDTSSPGNGANLAWSVSVVSGGVPVAGRVFSDSIAITNTATTAFSLYAVTDTGGVYRETLRGYNGVDSTLQVNNKGNVRVGDPKCEPAYVSVPVPQSVEAGRLGAGFWQPMFGDECAGLKTYRLFLDEPAADLPASVSAWADGRTTEKWLAPKYAAPTITDLSYERDTFVSNAGVLTGVLGTQPGTVNVQIDVDGDGSYTGAGDRVLSVIVPSTGRFRVVWDGNDAAGNPVPTSVPVQFTASLTRTNEAHFLRFDTEDSIGGIEVTRLTGGDTSTDRLYWNDSLLAASSANRDSIVDPLTSTTQGVASTGGVHAWSADPTTGGNSNTGLAGSWGDYRAIVDWTYGADGATASMTIPEPTRGQLRIAKTAVHPVVEHGGQAEFSITVSNIGDEPAVFDLIDEPTLDHLTDVTITPEGGLPQTSMTVTGLALSPGESTTLTETGTVDDGNEEWVIPNRATVTTPEGFDPTEVEYPCEDDPTYSCATVTTPAVIPAVIPAEAVTPPAPAPVVLAHTGADNAVGAVIAGVVAALIISAGIAMVMRRRRNTTPTTVTAANRR